MNNRDFVMQGTEHIGVTPSGEVRLNVVSSVLRSERLPVGTSLHTLYTHTSVHLQHSSGNPLASGNNFKNFPLTLTLGALKGKASLTQTENVRLVLLTLFFSSITA
jgi:hypothetical protein